jgi:3-hydroxyisobutyrate dehydrogenase
MVGGPEDVFRSCLSMFELMGMNITHMGGAGCGQHTKMVNQILISTCMIGVCEGLLYAQKAGLPLEPVMAAVGSGAAGSWSLSNYGPRILSGNFDPGFFVEVQGDYFECNQTEHSHSHTHHYAALRQRHVDCS